MTSEHGVPGAERRRRPRCARPAADLPTAARLRRVERLDGVGRLELQPFSRLELSAQLLGILGSHPEITIADALFQRSGGNPFFAEELLAATADGNGHALPETLRDALMVRVETLSATTQQLLRVIAAAGRSVTHGLLAAVTSVEGDTFQGTCKVKLGPIALQYSGSGQFLERDAENFRMLLEANAESLKTSRDAGVSARAAARRARRSISPTAAAYRSLACSGGKVSSSSRNMRVARLRRSASDAVPTSSAAASLVGFVRADGTAGGGLEVLMDATLKGKAGRTVYEQSQDGRPIPNARQETTAPVAGKDVRLTIDIDPYSFL